MLRAPFMTVGELSLLSNLPHWFEASLAVYQYDKQVQNLIHLFKYRKTPQLAKLFGKAMSRVIDCEPEMPSIDFITPVPLHPSRYRERGYNQSALLAQEISRHSGLPVKEILKRHIFTSQQASKDRYARMKNVLGAFSIKENKIMQNASIALVDDVVTTGSTMNECARVLCAAGARRVIAVSVTRISREANMFV